MREFFRIRLNLRGRKVVKLTLPRAVVFCRDDASLPPGAFQGMARGLGEFDLIEIEDGHEALCTRPQEVAKGLIQAAAG